MERYSILFTFFIARTYYALCVYLTFIEQYFNILYLSWQFSYNIVLLLNLYTETKILTLENKNGRTGMVTRKASNEKFIQ